MFLVAQQGQPGRSRGYAAVASSDPGEEDDNDVDAPGQPGRSGYGENSGNGRKTTPSKGFGRTKNEIVVRRAGKGGSTYPGYSGYRGYSDFNKIDDQIEDDPLFANYNENDDEFDSMADECVDKSPA